jgi:hypothetical protein
VGVYPHDTTYPDSVMNLWNRYDVEKIPQPLEPNDDLKNEVVAFEAGVADPDLFLNHLKIITKESADLEFLLDWLANMFQYPSHESIMVAIQGEEGSGKSVICDFITKIFGREYCIEINHVAIGLFGLFAYINEIDRTTMSSYGEQLKAMITTPTLPIEDKGINDLMWRTCFIL